MIDKEKEKPDFVLLATKYSNFETGYSLTDDWEKSFKHYKAGLEHIWQTEVVKRDEEIKQLRNSLQFETEELSRIKEGLLKIQSELAKERDQLREEIKQLKEQLAWKDEVIKDLKDRSNDKSPF